MAISTDKFVERQNIVRFTTLLLTETDRAKRELLQKLLTGEMVKQARARTHKSGSVSAPR
jgi:hypothetical protein